MKIPCLSMIVWIALTTNPSVEIVLRPVDEVIGSVETVQLQTSAKQQKSTAVVVLTGLVGVRQDSEIIDFIVQRQKLAIGAQSEDKSPAWESINIDDARKLLEEAPARLPDTLPSTQFNPVITMPLPNIVGTWPKSVVHPRLTDNHYLFRLIDFSVRPGHHYRYRVKLEYVNPHFRKSSDPFVSSGATRLSPWSIPCTTVTIK